MRLERAMDGPTERRQYPFEVARESVGREWDGRVAREVAQQARIEAAFDRVDACGRLGDFERALEWLERAEELAGGLSPAYSAQRARWAGQLARPNPASAVDGTGSGEGFVFEVRGGPEAGIAARQAVIASNGALPASVRADVLLLVTELVTNAVRHAGVGPEQPIRVGLRRLPQRVRVEVTDPGSGFARVHPRSNGDDSGGWGLLLVDRIADRWGAWPTASGTCVWFEVRPEGDTDASL
jgi:signal transduction histidine kinase